MSAAGGGGYSVLLGGGGRRGASWSVVGSAEEVLVFRWGGGYSIGAGKCGAGEWRAEGDSDCGGSWGVTECGE